MMIHSSISAREPERIARFIAALWGGEAHPFPPCPGAYVALANDERGTLLEVNPAGSEMIFGKTEIEYAFDRPETLNSPSHHAIATDLSEAEVTKLAAAERFPARRCWRGPPGFGFTVIEVWLEGRLLIEVLTREMQAEYKKFMTPGNWTKLLAMEPPQ